MKKILLLAILLIVTVFLYFGNNNGWFKGNKGERRDFAVTDTAAIDKIFMADIGGTKILLEKVGGEWKVNGKYDANQGWLKQLFETIYKVKVKNPVPKNALNAVIKNLSAEHIKVEIYTHNELNKTYYVGGSTHDLHGTYMWIENSDVPFICEIPGWEGFLQPRYNLNEMTWRSRKVFGINPEEISEVKIIYRHAQKKGFTILQEKGNVGLKTLDGISQNPIDTIMVKYYLNLFKEVHAEAFGMVFKEENSDSIRNSPFWCRIEVKHGDKLETLNIHQRKINERTKQQFDMKGNELNVDTERYYAYKNNSHDAMLIQDYVFANFFRSIEDFSKKKK